MAFHFSLVWVGICLFNWCHPSMLLVVLAELWLLSVLLVPPLSAPCRLGWDMITICVAGDTPLILVVLPELWLLLLFLTGPGPAFPYWPSCFSTGGPAFLLLAAFLLAELLLRTGPALNFCPPLSLCVADRWDAHERGWAHLSHRW